MAWLPAITTTLDAGTGSFIMAGLSAMRALAEVLRGFGSLFGAHG